MLRVAFVPNSETAALPIVAAVKQLRAEGHYDVEVVARCAAELADESVRAAFLASAVESHIIIVHLMGGTATIPGYAQLAESALQVRPRFHVVGSEEVMRTERGPLSTLEPADGRRLSGYVRIGGARNYRAMLMWLAAVLDGQGADLAPQPQPLPWEGIYHPDLPEPPDLDAYLRRLPAGRPTIGMLFFRSYWVANNLAHIDALIRALEARGANALPVFTNSVPDVDLGARGAAAAVRAYLMRDGRPLVDVLINTLTLFPIGGRPRGRDDGEGVPGVLERLGAPVLQALSTSYTLEQWHESLQGLSPMDVSFSAAIPEFDGALITAPLACRERRDVDPYTGARIVRLAPVPERLDKLVSLTLNWARLRALPNAEKRVAVILHNYPPRNDTIGTAFCLDAPASVVNILRSLEAAGYDVGAAPASGDDLIAELMKRVTNDRTLLTDEMARLAVDTVAPARYGTWFDAFPPKVADELARDWGAPPGDVFKYNGKLLIPGIRLGNVFLGIQPPRGFGEDPNKIYHNPDASPPHHYLAYYRWIRDVFGAHVVMHIGKHGSLEWLPGKAVALSGACYPELAIDDLPNVYPYIINNPGEGTQAKRRIGACLIDHLPPPMMRADAYGETERLEALLQDYYQSRQMDPQKLPTLRDLIWESVEKANLSADLQIAARPTAEEWDEFLQRLHGYLSELDGAQIRNGLHILGEAPEGERLVEMLAALVRLENGAVPSLWRGLAAVHGYDYDDLLTHRGELAAGSTRTKGMLLAQLDAEALGLIRALQAREFAPDQVSVVCREMLRAHDGAAPAEQACVQICETLRYVCQSLVMKVRATVHEITAVSTACAGGYVAPGPSGAPTRGMADILPTGRNFYTVDPLAIPSPAAWREGQALAQALLSRYVQDTGEYPRNIGMVVWGGGVMRTRGDDIAEILYLLGVQPEWDARGGRVKGLQVIPLAELGRPRIDVTVRISGLLRDTFPSVVNLLDRAVHMVADLDEPDESNYLRQHMRAEVQRQVEAGADMSEAQRLAAYRIFGCKPGSYGAGVSNAIDAGNWRDAQDLGAIYLTWGGYAYGADNYGSAAPEVFRQRLAQLDLTVKNEDNREHDILDSDDFYSYHGGLVAAVKAFKGAAPHSYVGDASDPHHMQVRTLAEESRRIFRTRGLNPKWIASMQRHGYKGAGDLAKFVDHAFGWDATADVVEDWMYEGLARTYALDEAMQRWFEQINPWALQAIAGRLLEAAQRGLWAAPEEMLGELQRVYLHVDGLLEGRSER